ncbi:General transcription factor II-I repeat domain-containing protein 2 [Eumeta japonica]|uniref:General transcription factor II-I repeat domain-containing protein 2 n=1 Tax=Eumeta variegata TaxID=151549 RepID=A0A4C1YYU5_EUMVA|nr:General transcription factor II-I repeat domain-containing protein 2 [Eumeta japonica]
MLKRFYEFRNEIADYMQIKNKPLSALGDPKWLYDLAFMVGLTGYLNDLNLELQKNKDSFGCDKAMLWPAGLATENGLDPWDAVYSQNTNVKKQLLLLRFAQ